MVMLLSMRKTIQLLFLSVFVLLPFFGEAQQQNSTYDEALAKALGADDYGISEGLLKASLYPWYGSAALPLYLESSEKIWKIKP